VLIDLIALVLLIMAIVKGWHRGLLIAVLSMVAFIVGIAAAMKLSVLVAGWLSNSVNISAKWLPVVSFILVFVVVVLLVRAGANLLDEAVEMAFLGWLNKLGGIIFFGILYMMAYSVILFYANQLQLIKESTIKNSVTWSTIQPWGPYVINKFAQLLPIFKDMFIQLEDFFGRIAVRS
jgi:membrane protein required for colicin V production